MLTCSPGLGAPSEYVGVSGYLLTTEKKAARSGNGQHKDTEYNEVQVGTTSVQYANRWGLYFQQCPLEIALEDKAWLVMPVAFR